METTNLSKIKRDKLLEKIQVIKEQTDDEEIISTLNEIEIELTKKKYGLVWEEHLERVDEEMRTKIPVFEEVSEKEILFDKEDGYNFLLEGDNLHSLKLLEKTHKGKIDVIYIDPPYNTGNKDFIYNDKIVGNDDFFKHSKWLSFMNRRLDIAKKLLSPKGIFFISVDDNEFAQLKMLCDEILDENNFVTAIHWKRSESQNNNAKQIAVVGEYIICYANNKHNNIFNKIELKETAIKEYRYIDETGRRFRRGTIVDNTRGKNILTVTSPNGITKTIKSIRNKSFFEEKNKNNEIYWTKTGTPYLKIYLDSSAGQVASNWFDTDGVNEDAAEMLRNINVDFSFSKPVKLIKKLINLYPQKNSIILDFFAGSGTTAHAVLELNKEDGGNRKFILCTNNENNICKDITYPRVKTVITGKRIDGSEYSKGIKANLKYYKTDFVDKTSDGMVSDSLLSHVIELIQLEHHCNIDNDVIKVAFNEKEMEEIINSNLDNCKKVFVSIDIFMASEWEEVLKERNIEVLDIPEYYFSEELMEVDEI